MARKNKPKLQAISVAPEWIFPSDIVSRYATNLLVQFSPHECTISFFEVRNPILLGTPEENYDVIKNLKSVPANCVSRVVVAINRVPEVINAIQTGYEKHLQSQLQIAEAKQANGEKK